MKQQIALLAVAALSLAACGSEPSQDDNAVVNQLEAGENVVWNDLATVPAEPEASVEAASPEAERAAETEPAAPAPKAATRPKPKAPAPRPEPKAEPEPETDPHAGHDMNTMNHH